MLFRSHARFESQKDAITQAFDDIVQVFAKEECMPLITLTELVHAHTENNRWKEHNVGPLWENYLKRNRVDFTALNRTRYKIKWYDETLRDPQAKIYIVPGSEQREFDLSSVYKKKPNYDSILPNSIGKLDLVIG